MEVQPKKAKAKKKMSKTSVRKYMSYNFDDVDDENKVKKKQSFNSDKRSPHGSDVSQKSKRDKKLQNQDYLIRSRLKQYFDEADEAEIEVNMPFLRNKSELAKIKRKESRSFSKKSQIHISKDGSPLLSSFYHPVASLEDTGLVAKMKRAQTIEIGEIAEQIISDNRHSLKQTNSLSKYLTSRRKFGEN